MTRRRMTDSYVHLGAWTGAVLFGRVSAAFWHNARPSCQGISKSALASHGSVVLHELRFRGHRRIRACLALLCLADSARGSTPLLLST